MRFSRSPAERAKRIAVAQQGMAIKPIGSGTQTHWQHNILLKQLDPTMS
jgi:hypothetical protein